MLTKLLKHEFRATARIMGPLYLVLLAVALGFNFSARLMDSGNFGGKRSGCSGRYRTCQ